MNSNIPIRIVFMGTPEFAATSLQYLFEKGFNIVGVVTAPDRPSGRGRKLTGSAVKVCAESLNLPILQPVKLKDPGFLEQLESWNPDLIIVVAFRMLPKLVWAIPPMGTLNLHASLLPQYRGAAPLNWVLINGEDETGLTTFFINERIDTGSVLLQERVSLNENISLGKLHDVMMVQGAKLIERTIIELNKGEIVARSQEEMINEQYLKTAPKLTAETGRIDWTQAAQNIHNLIRGLSPYPGAYTYFETADQVSMKCKILLSKTLDGKDQQTIAAISQTPSTLVITTGEGQLQLLEIQPEGKKAMKTEEFLRGFRQKFVRAI